ncbi:uncharacterized protein LOC135681005 [Rhopilema esculentum]|uniref:uncharacterized protein LOC135681005 n=1 Tax=Rhopilema esculentum TaxID=499914 RepID=UPI0031E2A454
MKGNISTDLSYFFAAIFMLSRSIALKNVALNKPTKQSSTFNGSVPSIAVDGNSSNMFCSQTGFQTKPWWRVELMDTYTIEYVSITSRRDCCWSRLRMLQVKVGYSPSHAHNKHCAFHSGSFGQGETKDFFCSTMARGSYVSIQLLASGYLSLVEVQVFVIDDLIPTFPSSKLTGNIALQKPAKQSSNFFKCINKAACLGGAQMAVDGNFSSIFRNGTCTHTKRQHNPWWMVDLSDRHVVRKISLTNRGDCCSNRLQMVEIRVGDNPCSSTSNAMCRYIVGEIGKGVTFEFECKPQRRGRFVFISLRGSTSLTLCEVQVFAQKGASRPWTKGNLSCRGESKAWIAGIVSLIVAIFCCWRASVAKKRNAPTSAPAPPAARAPPAASATPPPASHSRQESSENGRRYSDPVLGTDDNQTVRKNTSAPPPIAFIPLPNVAPPRYDEIYKWDNTATATPPPLYSNLDINTLPSVSISDTSSPAVLSCYNPAFNLDEGATASSTVAD